MQKTLLYGMLLTLGLGTWLWAESPTAPGSSAAVESSSTGAALPTPLPADLFTGQTREAYKAAAEIPDILAGLHCYCGCDKSLGHRSLLYCFVDDHGAG
jgi:hypothetical protein